jgi:hypothetical protein
MTNLEKAIVALLRQKDWKFEEGFNYPEGSMQRELDLERKERLLEKELDELTSEVLELKRTHRADLDTLKLEMEALKQSLAQLHPDFNERFQALKEKIQVEISPE